MSHIETCRVPRTFLRKAGEVWCCPTCSKLWTLRQFFFFMDRYKVWTPIEKDGEQS